MTKHILPAAFAIFAALSLNMGSAHAAGCLSGAAVGGVAGHLAGHHGVLGAAAGCAVGHHEAKKKAATDPRPRRRLGSNRLELGALSAQSRAFERIQAGRLGTINAFPAVSRRGSRS